MKDGGRKEFPVREENFNLFLLLGAQELGTTENSPGPVLGRQNFEKDI